LRRGCAGQVWEREYSRAAENAAVRNGGRAAILDTLRFQAPAFYEKRGYVRVGVVDNYRGGVQRVFMQKRLEEIDRGRQSLARGRRSCKRASAGWAEQAREKMREEKPAQDIGRCSPKAGTQLGGRRDELIGAERGPRIDSGGAEGRDGGGGRGYGQ
jgi:hypothetical protein